MKPPPPTPYYATKIKLGLEKWSERILIFFEALLPNYCAQLSLPPCPTSQRCATTNPLHLDKLFQFPATKAL